jgi:lambda family phage portal protein
MKWPWTKRVKETARTAVRFIRATFDSAYTTSQNRRHWAHADFLSANAAARPDVRRVLRNRARYEVANNSYARGVVLTLANDVVGTGPRLQMLLGDGTNDDGKNVNGLIEREFAAWAKAIDLPGKLRTMRETRAQDGEAFGLLHTNGRLQHPVKLDTKLIEADQVTTPLFSLPTPTFVDGIVLDEFGNPKEYHVLNQHPGDFLHTMPLKYRVIPAANMVHWFRKDRPGQSRGLPDILPALPLFAQLRRYTLAVIAAAESAANVAIFMKTTAPAGGEAAEVDPMTTMEFEPNMAVFGPEGWEPTQIKAEQPSTTYDMFKREILNEIARCLNMPYNIAACNSSGYNYSSGRLDHQTYYKSIRVDQSDLERVVLDRLLDAWMEEAVKVYPELDGLEEWPHQWFWDGHDHVDPQKEAVAQAQRLASNTTTLAAEYAKQGKDWEAELRQRAKEVALMNELGLPIEVAKPQLEPAPPTEQEDEQETRNAKPDRKPKAA